MSLQLGAASRFFRGNAAPAIPDSVVERTQDNKTNSLSSKFGLRITTDVEWADIGGRLSANTSGVTKAYIYRVSDGNLLGSADISSLGSGETFTVTGVNLKPYDNTTATEYNFVVDAEGATYNPGYYSTANFPFTSNDGNLSIINGGDGPSSTNPNPYSIDKVGNVGF